MTVVPPIKMRQPLVFTTSVLKEPRLPPLCGSWTSRSYIRNTDISISKDGFPSVSTSFRASDQSPRYHASSSSDTLDPFADALDSIRNGFVGTVEDIARSHKHLQRRIVELESTVEHLRKEKEAEESHAQRLTDLLSRESKKTEAALQKLRETTEANQALGAEVSELQNLYFRSTELAQPAQEDTVVPEAATDERWLEQESIIHQLRLELSVKEPLVLQLQEQVEHLLLENALLARESPETVLTSFTDSTKDHPNLTLDVKLK